MDTAAVVFDFAADDAAPGKLSATSQTPKKATVEDYLSENEPKRKLVVNKRESPYEPIEPRKPIIGNTSSPKRATVSWLDEQAYSKSSDLHDRTSRLSEAFTAVSSNLDAYGRMPTGRTERRVVPRDSPNRESNGRRATRMRMRMAQESSSSDSGEEEDRFQCTGARKTLDRRWPIPPYYTEFSMRGDRALNEPLERGEYMMAPYHPDHPPRYPLAAKTNYNHDIDPTAHHSGIYSRLRPDSMLSGSRYVGDTRSQGLYLRNKPPSWDDEGYPSVALPVPHPPTPSRPQLAIARKMTEERPEKDQTLDSINKQELAKLEKELTVSKADNTEKFQDLMLSLQQTLNKYNAASRKAESEILARSSSAMSLDLPPAIDLHTQTSMTDLDLIKLMEERMQALKRKNEEKLIEANQVLAYFDRRSDNNRQKLDHDTGSNEPGDMETGKTEVPNVHMFRTPEDETDYDDDSENSESTGQDSMAGNSSGSSISSLEQRARQVNRSRKTIAIVRDRNEVREVADATEEESTDCDDTDHGPMAPESEVSFDTPIVAEEGLGSESVDASIQPTLDVQAEHNVMKEVVALRRDLSALQGQITRRSQSWLGNTLFTAVAKCRRHLRESPRPGTQRLEWTCECGDEMYADLPLENGAQYQQMLEFLTRPGPKTQQADQNQTTPSQLEGGTARLDYTTIQSSQRSFGQGASPASTIGSGSTYVGSGSSQILNAQHTDPFARNKYLELCIDVGKYETKLAEIQVSCSQSSGAAICTDAHLFRQIYHRYFALRKHTWRRFLYRPVGIKFVHFGVQAGYRVSFFSNDPLPSEDEITAKRYEYSLQPPVPPPIDSRTFLHYFYKHNTHSHSTSAKYINRLPKKLGDSLTRSLGVDDLLEGWGIHIVEGPNKVAICWALMVVLIVSLGVSIGYDLVTRSGDSGFAIGQWMVAALTVGLSALYFSLEDDVNSNFD
ncbi:hypothetical protein SVAN01_04271 [Stagonosporopsis vannaccii]|nr:hypothetical protein SVAN01_04271 [Stagonosporopsis vannaccii]